MDIYGSVLLLLAAIIIVALAVALSARFNIVVTLSACIGIFLLGLISDYTFGRFAETQLWAKIGRFLCRICRSSGLAMPFMKEARSLSNTS